MLDKKDMYAKLKNGFDRSIDSRRMGSRKSVLMSGLDKYGYTGAVLLFEKAKLSEIKLGDMPIDGWVVLDTIKNPTPKAENGLVICQKK
ncbi:MAG: hypothetical protein IKE91_07465 [Clostridia bacterium]|nr:hypothetical protein [Clostridia bacterium]